MFTQCAMASLLDFLCQGLISLSMSPVSLALALSDLLLERTAPGGEVIQNAAKLVRRQRMIQTPG